MRERRNLLGLRLDDLANAVGITYQQLQKYEKGVNRIGGGRLYALAGLLQVPVGYFYENLDRARRAAEVDNDSSAAGAVPHREVLELVRLYSALEPEIRKSLVAHMRTLTRNRPQTRSDTGLRAAAQGEESL
ncbi:MAG TPA: helix-turn-helix domain-containing protein [Bryobacteraceae bacterium]|nr:helix-turn-helix domain-containing protein [Bryobacteraceae bacterium]